MSSNQILSNRTFAEIKVGDSETLERVLTQQDILLFAVMSGDVNPSHLDEEYAASTPLHSVVAHGMWGGSIISALLGTKLPGPGTVYKRQDLRFHKSVHVGDLLKVTVEVTALDPQHQTVILDCKCVNQNGDLVISGEAEVTAPLKKIERAVANLPEIKFLASSSMATLLNNSKNYKPIKVVVVHPCDSSSLGGALDAYQAGLIEPILVGPRARIESIAQENNFDLANLVINDVPFSHAAAEYAADIANKGEVQAIMKGSLHTDELMSAIFKTTAPGLRTKRRVSHCFVMQTPAYPRPFIVTDAAINIAPTLEQKADIIKNAITLAHAIGVECPKVALLAAVETVTPTMPATLDAAALCKMADRGQIKGALLDGPLAFDNAISMAAAQTKGIVSQVAGQADILVAPDLESANMLAKQIMYMSQAASAGVVLGIKLPIILTSRSDTRESKMASCALAVMLAHHFEVSPP